MLGGSPPKSPVFVHAARLEKQQRSAERLASLSIMGAQLRTPLKPLKNHHSTIALRGLRGPALGPHYAERR